LFRAKINAGSVFHRHTPSLEGKIKCCADQLNSPPNADIKARPDISLSVRSHGLFHLISSGHQSEKGPKQVFLYRPFNQTSGIEGLFCHRPTDYLSAALDFDAKPANLKKSGFQFSSLYMLKADIQFDRVKST
jgi:hypothetical protein